MTRHYVYEQVNRRLHNGMWVNGLVRDGTSKSTVQQNVVVYVTLVRLGWIRILFIHLSNLVHRVLVKSNVIGIHVFL